MVQNRVFFDTLLTIADKKGVPSKDWIAPPSQSSYERMVDNSAGYC